MNNAFSCIFCPKKNTNWRAMKARQGRKRDYRCIHIYKSRSSRVGLVLAEFMWFPSREHLPRLFLVRERPVDPLDADNYRALQDGCVSAGLISRPARLYAYARESEYRSLQRAWIHSFGRLLPLRRTELGGALSSDDELDADSLDDSGLETALW